jgi:hypothetical protein
MPAGTRSAAGTGAVFMTGRSTTTGPIANPTGTATGSRARIIAVRRTNGAGIGVAMPGSR